MSVPKVWGLDVDISLLSFGLSLWIRLLMPCVCVFVCMCVCHKDAAVFYTTHTARFFAPGGRPRFQLLLPKNWHYWLVLRTRDNLMYRSCIK
jgi:hypothetical protein